MAQAALGIAALSAVRSKDSYLGAQFRRIAARRGGKRAASATSHTLLTAIWHILQRRQPYHDLGADFFLNRIDPDRQRRRAIAQLEHLGYTVTIQTTPA